MLKEAKKEKGKKTKKEWPERNKHVKNEVSGSLVKRVKRVLRLRIADLQIWRRRQPTNDGTSACGLGGGQHLTEHVKKCYTGPGTWADSSEQPELVNLALVNTVMNLRVP
jgi:hypothetical protein